MREVVQTVAEVVIAGVLPGVGSTVTVLGWIYQVCREVKECKESCEFTHRRLTMILEELEKMEAEKTAPTDAVEKFHGSLKLLWTNLAPYKGMVFFERLLRHKKLKDTIATVNGELDALCEMLAIASDRAMMEWKIKWNDDVQVQNEMLRKLLTDNRTAIDELQTVQRKVDMLMLLVVEQKAIKENKSEQPEEVKELINKSVRTLVVKAETRVQDVPSWFIAEASVTYMPTPFASGSFGSVHSGTYVGGDVVVKLLLPGEHGLDKKAQSDFMAEVTIWSNFRHTHVIKMIGACHVSTRPFIVSERAAKGNMAECLQRDAVSTTHMWNWLHQVALGLKFLHEQRVVHGDLKLNNVLIGGDNLARIADFGLSRVKNSSSAKMTTLASGKAVGGLRWMAPERFLKEPQFVSDIYALGMCVIEAASGDAPYGNVDDDSVRELIKKGIRPARPASLSDRAWTLVTKMTEKNHQDRIKLDAVIKELEDLAQEETTKFEDSVPFCDVCNEAQRPGAKWCDFCGTSLSGGGDAVRESPAQARPAGTFVEDVVVSSLLRDITTASDDKKAHAVKLLYRRKDDKTTCAEIKTEGGVDALLTLAKESKSFASGLYAFGCLEALRANTGNPTLAELDGVIEHLDSKVAHKSPEVNSLIALLDATDASQRDERQAAELVVLVLGLSQNPKPNQNALSSVVGPLARALSQVSNDVSDAVLVALAALTKNHGENLGLLHKEKAVTSLLKALASPSLQSQQLALELLVELTNEFASAAQPCRTAQHIRPLVALLEDGDDDTKEKVLTFVKNITKGDTTMLPLLGSRGMVAVLVEMLDSPSARLKSQAFKTLAVLCADPSNAVMFKQAGGVQCVKDLLTSSTPSAAMDIMFDLSQLLVTDDLRRAVAADTELLRVCLSKFESEDPAVSTNAARVLGELVKGNVNVLRAVDRTEKLLEKLARRVDEATGTARLHAFRTLLDALPPGDATPAAGRVAAPVAEAA